MDKIQVKVISEHGQAIEMMTFLARLTQRGADIKDMSDLEELMKKPTSTKLIESMMKMEHHGTIKRFTPITVAIVGASRRFLAQARTNQVGFNYVSASLQYSDYTGKSQFVVPYAILEADNNVDPVTLYSCGEPVATSSATPFKDAYLSSCEASMRTYKMLASALDNDTAGYAAPQGLRNILIMQGNTEAWLHFINTRTCNRNTNETQYVAFRIWEELLKTEGGETIFKYAGPDCRYGPCKEGKMCCGSALKATAVADSVDAPRYWITQKWPLIKDVTTE